MLASKSPSVTLSELPVSATFSDLQEVSVFPNASVETNRFCDTRVQETNSRCIRRNPFNSFQMWIVQLGSPAHGSLAQASDRIANSMALKRTMQVKPLAKSSYGGPDLEKKPRPLAAAELFFDIPIFIELIDPTTWV